MKKNLQWIEKHESLLAQLPQVLSVACACYVEIDYEHLLEELKLRHYVEIAPLEPEETDEHHDNEVVWHMDHLELKPRRYEKFSSFSCSRILVLIIAVTMVISTILQLGDSFNSILNPYGKRRN